MPMEIKSEKLQMINNTLHKNGKLKFCMVHYNALNKIKQTKKSPNGLFFNGGNDASMFELFVNRFIKHLLTPSAYRICDLIEKLSLIV